jgi:Family of unknown function (DUF6444)
MTVPAEAQASIAATFVAVWQRVVDVEAKVRDLETRFKLNSTNLCKPPSSDPIGMTSQMPAARGER